MSFDPVDALSEGVNNGINQFAIGLGDDMLNMSASLTGVDKSYPGKMLVDIATFTYNPLKDPAVINALQESALLYVVFVLMFIFVGGAFVHFSRLKPARELLGSKLSPDMSLSSFFWSAVGLIILGPIVPFLMLMVLIFNYVLCQLIMTGILPSILLSPDNVALYVGMALIYLLMSLSFVWRAYVIGISMAYCLIIVALLAIPQTRRLGKGLVWYYILMVFMQPVILLITCVGVGILKFIAPFDPPGQVFCLLVLGVLLFVVSLIFILGPFTIMRLLGGSKKLKLVI